MPTRRSALDVTDEAQRMRPRPDARNGTSPVRAGVNLLLQRTDLAGLRWPLPTDLDAEGLHRRPLVML